MCVCYNEIHFEMSVYIYLFKTKQKFNLSITIKLYFKYLINLIIDWDIIRQDLKI